MRRTAGRWEEKVVYRQCKCVWVEEWSGGRERVGRGREEDR